MSAGLMPSVNENEKGEARDEMDQRSMSARLMSETNFVGKIK